MKPTTAAFQRYYGREEMQPVKEAVAAAMTAIEDVEGLYEGEVEGFLQELWQRGFGLAPQDCHVVIHSL